MTGFLHPSDEVVKEAEAAAVEDEAFDFPEVDADRKHEATLRDVPTVGASLTGWRVDRFPRGPGRTPVDNDKSAQREMRAKWHADDHDAFAAQEERRSSW